MRLSKNTETCSVSVLHPMNDTWMLVSVMLRRKFIYSLISYSACFWFALISNRIPPELAHQQSWMGCMYGWWMLWGFFSVAIAATTGTGLWYSAESYIFMKALHVAVSIMDTGGKTERERVGGSVVKLYLFLIRILPTYIYCPGLSPSVVKHIDSVGYVMSIIFHWPPNLESAIRYILATDAGHQQTIMLFGWWAAGRTDGLVCRFGCHGLLTWRARASPWPVVLAWRQITTI